MLAGSQRPEFFMGTTKLPLDQITMVRNFTYQNGTGGAAVQMGYAVGNGEATFRDNYIVGQVDFTSWKMLHGSGNDLVGSGTSLRFATPKGESASDYAWNANRYFTARTTGKGIQANLSGSELLYTLEEWRGAVRLDGTSSLTVGVPTSTRVFVRPNRYEPGRAHVVVYNWARSGSVSVNLGTVLPVGAKYEIRSAQNFWAGPVLSGTYGGGSVSVPIGTVSAAEPVGGSPSPPPVTAPEFEVFVVLRVD
jgi:hypothetical protein